MISHQECKCRCLTGESRYGEACQSFQYYFDSNTCLINKQNRFSNSENFNYVPSSQKRSYFEHRCATRDDIRAQYLADYCSDSFESPQGGQENSRGPGSDHEIGTKETTTTPSLKSRDNEHDEVDQSRATEEMRKREDIPGLSSKVPMVNKKEKAVATKAEFRKSNQ
ncbi:PAN domain protein [Cooperia oncophora]